jgi:hypothetical protein
VSDEEFKINYKQTCFLDLKALEASYIHFNTIFEQFVKAVFLREKMFLGLLRYCVSISIMVSDFFSFDG